MDKPAMERTYDILERTEWLLQLPPRADAGPVSGPETVSGLRPGLTERIPETTLDKEIHNDKALEEFLAGQETRAFYIAQAALWDREEALDVVQDSMLRLIQYYRHKPATEWPALFHTILNSRINDVRRKRMLERAGHKLVSLTGLFGNSREPESATVVHDLPAAERTDGVTTPESGYLAGELQTHIDRALGALSERQRQVFILREWRGMSINETATVLGCSENSIKQHHFRALRELRRQLAEVWEHVQSS
jgi:RNA polymerase sigma-70 factor (ECF subfamily)